MANVKISELTQVTTLDNNDVLPIVNGGETKKVTVQQIVDSVPVPTPTSAGWRKIADINVTSSTVGVGTDTIKVALEDLSIKSASRVMCVVEPFTTESKSANSMTIQCYVRPETGTYYNATVFNAPLNNLVTKANSINYGMATGDIANNGDNSAIILLVTHGITQYSNANSSGGNTRHETLGFNGARIDEAHQPYFHCIASNYVWESGSKMQLFIM